MRPAYTEIDFAVLNELLKIPGAKVIGGRVLSDSTLRLFLHLDEKADPFDKSPKFIDISRHLDKTGSDA